MKKITLYTSEIIEILKKDNVEYETLFFNKIKKNQKFQIASLKKIVPSGLYFCTNSATKLMQLLDNSIVITNSEKKDNLKEGNYYILVNNPQLVHYQLTNHFETAKETGIHSTAIIHPKAKIHEDAYIGPYSIIGECIIEKGVQLHGLTKIYDNSIIQRNTTIEANCAIGPRGMAWVWDEKGNRVMQPQMGGVIIEEDVYLGTDISVVRGSLTENTRIGKGTVIAHGSKIGHGANIGEFVHMANNVSISGNAKIGNRAFMGSGAIISSNITLPPNSIVGAGALVVKNFEEEYLTLAGVPAKIIRRNNFEKKPNGAPKVFKK